MKGKELIQANSEGVLKDMMEALPEDLPASDNGHLAPPPPENVPPEINIMEMMLGANTEIFKKAVDILGKKGDDVKFSNLVLDGNDVAFIKENFDKYRILLSHNIPQPIPVVKLGGRTMATVADMTTITGMAKARKSYFLSAVLTAALNPTYYHHLEVTLPEGRNKIIWIDTEQSEYWSQQILYRVKRSGVATTTIDERIIYLNCRDLSVTQLKAVLYVSLEMYSSQSSFCIIDGSRDMVTSINDEEEAVKLSRWLPQMAKKYQTNITNVLHQNPSGGDGSKLRGVLGTELMNKSEFIIEIKAHPIDKKVFIAGSMLSRDIGTEDVFFEIDDGLLRFTDEPVDTRSEKSLIMYNLKIEDLKKLTSGIFRTKSKINQKNLSLLIQSQIKETINEHIGVQKIATEWIPYLENKGLIAIDDSITSNNGKARFYKKEEFAETDTTEALPF